MSKPHTTDKQKIFAANLWPIFNFGTIDDRFNKFLSRGRPAFKSLIENLILYEKILIPTHDFLSLSLLLTVLGEKAVLDMLETERISFLRLRGTLVYAGNGGGIQSMEEIRAPEGPDSGKPHIFCASIEETVQWAVSSFTDKQRDPLVAERIVESTQQIDIRTVVDEIRDETYQDVIKSPSLRNHFALRNTELTKLKGIEPNGIRIYGGIDGNWIGDEIDILMSLAATNLELRLAQRVDILDSSTASPVGHLIKAKAERSLRNDDVNQSFAVLKEVADIPDLGEGVLEKQCTIEQLIKLSQTRDGELFREWFHQNCNENPLNIAREHTALLRDVPKIQSIPSKILRFIVTTGLGFVPFGSLVGGLASATDSFFIEKWLRGHSPKYFIDDVRQLVGKPKELTQPKTSQSKSTPMIAQSKPGRNDPCSCGSGKKYKKCHG